MVSIQASLTELEHSVKVREAVLDCYQGAIKSVGQYAIDLDQDLTREFRKQISGLAGEISCGRIEALRESGSTLRALLRDFRDRNTCYVANLRDELAGTARALEEILESLAQTDGDHEARLKLALGTVRNVAASDQTGTLRPALLGATDAIEQSLADMKKQHQLTVSQFMTEIRILHKRIDAMEAAAGTDQITKFMNRQEMIGRIRSATASPYCLLLASVRGLDRAEVEFGRQMREEMAVIFAKRLRGALPPNSEAAHWGGEGFVIMAGISKTEAIALGKRMSKTLSGQYSCLRDGKVLRPTVHVTIGIVEPITDEPAERMIERVDLFFGGS